MKKSAIMILCFFVGVGSEVFAQIPTIVEAEANTPDGGRNISIVEQPANGGNPLGNPIVGPYIPPKAYNSADNAGNTDSISNRMNSNSFDGNLQNTNISDKALELGHDFENTLIEANDRVYSIQSYPVEDINVIGSKTMPQTIYSPNVNQ